MIAAPEEVLTITEAPIDEAREGDDSVQYFLENYPKIAERLKELKKAVEKVASASSAEKAGSHTLRKRDSN